MRPVAGATGVTDPSYKTGVTDPSYKTGVYKTGVTDPSYKTGVTDPSNRRLPHDIRLAFPRILHATRVECEHVRRPVRDRIGGANEQQFRPRAGEFAERCNERFAARKVESHEWIVEEQPVGFLQECACDAGAARLSVR